MYITTSGQTLASRGSVRAKKQLKTIPRNIYENKIVKNHLRTFKKLYSKGEPYRFSG